MENRFGFRDLVISALLVALLVVVLLVMRQYDRQWDLLLTISERLSEQTRELSQVRRMLQEGVAFVNPGRDDDPASVDDPAQQYGDPFDGVKAAAANPDYALGDWLVEAFGVKPPKLTPLLSSDVYAAIIQARVLEGMATQDPRTLEFKPLLAKSWQISDDGLTITFQLRRGITFSDGESFDADDVVFSYNWIMNPKVDAPRDRAYYKRIRSVEKLGPYEVVFRYDEPYFQAFDLAAAMGILPEHFYSQYTPEQFNRDPGLLMGTGPYRLKSPTSWRPGDPLVLVRNERYWGEPGPFDRMVYRVIENEAAELTAFRNGELDQFLAEPEQYQGMLADDELMSRVDDYELEHLRIGYLYIAWNQKRVGQRTRFADKRVRQAMTMLADRQGVCDSIYLGYGKVTTGPFHYLGEQADPNIERWPYDVKRARALLKQAGYEDRDGDGVLESPDGEPFKVKLTYPSSGETYKRIVLYLRDSFARGGVVIEPDPTDWPLMIQKLNTRDFEAITLGWSGGIETDIYQMFHSSQIGDKGDNFISYVNPELDEAVDQARRTMDKTERMALWRRCHRILHEDQPYTFLFRRKGLFFIDKRIRNIQQTKVGFNYVSRWVMPIEWYVPKARQKYGK
ncbi:MAG: peptide-binding protein [Phycisphaeraceae bacterium]